MYSLQNVAKFFINPLLYLWIMLLVLIIKKGEKKKIIFVLNILFYILSISYTSYLINAMWKVDDSFDPGTVYDAVVVLAGITAQEQFITTHRAEYPKEYFFRFNSQVNRILAGIGFVKAGNAEMLLVGDWRYKSYSEGQILKKFVLLQGVKAGKVKIYGIINRTVDEAKGVKSFIDKSSLKKILLVTSESHMRRAFAMFNKQRIFPDTYSVNKMDNKITWRSFVPSPGGLKDIMGCFYELTGYLGYYIKGAL